MAAGGVVVSIARFPVKSMAAEPLEAAEVFWPCLSGDRQFAFVHGGKSTDFPWLTARELPDLLRYRACYATPDPLGGRVTVTDPAGATFDVRDPALLDQLSAAVAAPVSLLRLGRGGYDAMPVSVLLTTTLEAIGRVHGAAVATERFRANVVIRPDDPSVTERDWLGHGLGFGGPDGARLRADWATPRCAMIGIDPVTARRDASLVRTVAQQFGNQVGAYCTVQRPGPIRVGDRVVVSPAPGNAAAAPVPHPVHG